MNSVGRDEKYISFTGVGGDINWNPNEGASNMGRYLVRYLSDLHDPILNTCWYRLCFYRRQQQISHSTKVQDYLAG